MMKSFFNINVALLLGLLTANIALCGNVKLATFNIRNFDYDERGRISTDKDALAKILNSLSFDVLAVEEINQVQVFKDFIQKRLPNHDTALSQCGGAHAQHLGFVFNKKKFKLNSFKEDGRLSEGCDVGVRPAAIADFTEIATGFNFTAIALHLKSGPKFTEKRYESLNIVMSIVNDLKKAGKVNFVIMGDLNTTDFSEHGSGFNRLNSFLAKNDFSSLSTKLKCTAYWWGGSDDGLESPSTLDHIIVNSNFKSNFKSFNVDAESHCKISSCKIMSPAQLGVGYTGVSDHCPVTGSFKE